MTQRTDIHRPSATITEDYTYVGYGDNMVGGDLAIDLRYKVAQTDVLHRGTSQCHHCGAHLRYYAILRHEPTGTYIAVGETCLENRFERATADFQRMRKSAELDRKAQRIVALATEAIANIERLDVQTAMAKDFDLSILNLSDWGSNVTADIRRRLWQYGSISDKQAALIGREIDKARVSAAAPPREIEVKIPAPTGKTTFTGTVIKIAWHDNEFGGCAKITVKVTQDDGVWLVWVTRPAAIHEVERGDIVNMTATLTRSDRDPAFAFGKRPSKASVIGHDDAEMISALD